MNNVDGLSEAKDRAIEWDPRRGDVKSLNALFANMKLGTTYTFIEKPPRILCCQVVIICRIGVFGKGG